MPGYPSLMAGFGDGGEFAYFDTTAAVGVIVEALRRSVALRRRFDVEGCDR